MHLCQNNPAEILPPFPRNYARKLGVALQLIAICVAWIAPFSSSGAASVGGSGYDVVVYGGTSCGVVAAVQAATMGKSVIIVEPGDRLGGLSSGGLGATDIGNKQAIGGLAREFYRRVHSHYQTDEAWKHETADAFAAIASRRTNDDTMWTFEPHVAERIFREWVDNHDIEVRYRSRLDRQSTGHRQGRRILALPLENGEVIEGSVFIDATYEGDLMDWAGVSYVVGREAAEDFDESLAGVQTQRASRERYVQRTDPFYHQFAMPIDPYVVPGDASSGLIPFVQPSPPGPERSGDAGVQAYCFRMTQTNVPENRLAWQPPPDYKAEDFELLLRYFDAGENRLPFQVVRMPNGKTDTNNNGSFSTDFIGGNHDWPEGSYAERERILANHRYYQQGLMWTLSQNPRVPEEIRDWVNEWGLCRDEFTDHGGWTPQLYVREARRMRSDYVMTQNDCQQKRTASDPISLAAYQIDSHHVHRYVKNGRVLNEGMLQVGGLKPYPISYRAIRPRREECENLLAPTCLSATHVAFGSIRMEPVFMILGQAAATAAAISADHGYTVQDVPYEKLRERLLADGNVLSWPPPTDSR